MTIDSMPDNSALDLVHDWTEGDEQALTFTLNDDAVTHVARRHIVRIDVDQEDA
ncbi:hypothetical protein [Paraoerskovia sediminicola]|uniref:hypothetical protein n=1 Tax=Paraoerskovia sediminicola TaxID=1138587 RepID=UPI00257465B9|nr:hypothetical protein [Paraoerskovia sediminicola]